MAADDDDALDDTEPLLLAALLPALLLFCPFTKAFSAGFGFLSMARIPVFVALRLCLGAAAALALTVLTDLPALYPPSASKAGVAIPPTIPATTSWSVFPWATAVHAAI